MTDEISQTSIISGGATVLVTAVVAGLRWIFGRQIRRIDSLELDSQNNSRSIDKISSSTEALKVQIENMGERLAASERQHQEALKAMKEDTSLRLIAATQENDRRINSFETSISRYIETLQRLFQKE